jgi:hypothetical protein
MSSDLTTPSYEDQLQRKAEKVKEYNRTYYAKMKAARERDKENTPIVSFGNSQGQRFEYSKKQVEEFIYNLDAETIRLLSSMRETPETNEIAEERDPFKRILRIVQFL